MTIRSSVVVLLFISISVQGIVNQDEVERSKFQQWKSKFGRVYKSLVEENKAMKNMMRNMREIEIHNIRFRAGMETYSRGLWEMSDLTFEEKTQTLAGSRINFSQVVLKGQSARLKSGPTQVNWVSEGRVHAVQNQGRCGSCFAFAAVGTVEGVALKKGIKTKFSVQQIVDCDQLDYGCDGLFCDFEVFF